MSEEKTGKEVDKHLSEQSPLQQKSNLPPHISPKLEDLNPILTNIVCSTGLQTRKNTNTHTTNNQVNLIKNNLPKVFAKKNINLPKVIPHPNQKINTPEFSALILQPSRKPVGDLAPRFREDHPFRPTFPKTPLFKAEKISGSRKEVPLGAGGMEGERFGAAWRSWWKWGSMG